MDGAIIRETIKTAPNWFAAVPSLHGGYPVLLLLLLWRERSRRAILAALTYGSVMWIATVALNQHYVIDLLAGAAVAFFAFALSERIGSWDATVTRRESDGAAHPIQRERLSATRRYPIARPSSTSSSGREGRGHTSSADGSTLGRTRTRWQRR